MTVKEYFGRVAHSLEQIADNTKKREKSCLKFFISVIIPIIGTAFALEKYFQVSHDRYQDRLDKQYEMSRSNLESSVPAIQAGSIRDLYDVGFSGVKKNLDVPSLVPFTYLINTMRIKNEYIYHEKSLNLIEQFATNRTVIKNGTYDLVSSEIFNCIIKWNDRVRYENENGGDFQYISTNNFVLNRSELIGLDLSNEILIGCDLKKSIFKNCNLSKTAIHKSIVDSVGFYGCDLNELDFAESSLVGVRFQFCNAYNMRFNTRNGKMSITSIQTNFVNSDFSKSHIVNSSFKTTDFSNVDFTGAKIENSFFSQCDFTGAVFDDLKISNATFIECKGISEKQKWRDI